MNRQSLADPESQLALFEAISVTPAALVGLEHAVEFHMIGGEKVEGIVCAGAILDLWRLRSRDRLVCHGHSPSFQVLRETRTPPDGCRIRERPGGGTNAANTRSDGMIVQNGSR
ncbi:MAG: hypothetical protein PSV46_19490 [Reyranella sp.]|nr:hypothetical protein [Reyranella sp.]